MVCKLSKVTFLCVTAETISLWPHDVRKASVLRFNCIKGVGVVRRVCVPLLPSLPQAERKPDVGTIDA